MPPALAPCAVIPASILRLGIRDQLEGFIEDTGELLVVRHTVGLPERESGKTVVVHVLPGAGDIQQAGRLGVLGHVAQGLLDGSSVAAPPGKVAGGKERKSSHPHEPEAVGVPIPFRALVPGKPRESLLESPLACRRDLPITFGQNR